MNVFVNDVMRVRRNIIKISFGLLDLYATN